MLLAAVIQACTHMHAPTAAAAAQVANTPAKPGSEAVAAAAGTSAALQQAGADSAAGLDGPVMLSSSDLEWGGEDGGAGVDQVPELQCRTRGLPDEDALGRLPSSAMSLGVSSTTFASLAFAGEGSSLARGTTIASGIGPIAGPAVSASTSASAVGSQQRPALSRFKDEELNCPICEWARAALLGARSLYCLVARGRHEDCAGSHTWCQTWPSLQTWFCSPFCST